MVSGIQRSDGQMSLHPSLPPPGSSGSGATPGRQGATLPAAGLRIVVVEDEALIALELEDLLAELGAEVVGTAMNAEEAIELAATQRPDCVTMDIRIQGPRDGISAALEIYRRFGIRAIFVSAYANPATAAQADAARPLGWLTKPIRANELAALLSALTDGSEA